ncbi:MAG: hypothetical protein GC164_07010 [Phycisphaera sp.]|nr:hypothetical protein [Phycisphaera sp.]
MPFHTGRVSFSRFFVTNESNPSPPSVVDEALLEKLAQGAFRASDVGVASEVEAGFVTGVHLFDTDFAYDKNGFTDALLFALRMDSHQVPPEVKQAYRAMSEQSLAKDNPSGYLTRAQKREAIELAERQVHDEVASNRYRRSKMVPVMWDLKSQTLFVAGSGVKLVEALGTKFKETFDLDLEPMTAGSLASRHMRSKGLSRDFEDLRPTAFSAAPDVERHEDGDNFRGQCDVGTPTVPWTHRATDTKDFLGNEFVFWLWSTLESRHGLANAIEDGQDVELAGVIDKAIDLECGWGVLGKVSIKAEGPTRLAETHAAITTGKFPRRIGLTLADPRDHQQWELSLQADLWQVSAAVLPKIEEANSPRELIEQRLQLIRLLAGHLDGLFAAFLKQRLSPGWSTRRDAIRAWLRDRRKSTAAQTVTV